MFHSQSFFRLLGLCLLLTYMHSARSELPKRNLSVELRQVEEREATSYTAGSTGQSMSSAVQWVQVRNGEKATLRLSHTTTLQWVQSVMAPVGTSADGGSTAPVPSNVGTVGVNSGMVMVESGQSLIVKPQWTGGSAPVTVEVELQTTQLQSDHTSPIPNQLRSTLGTVVDAPMGYWVVIATEGQAPASGGYSSEGGKATRKSWQIRVQAP